jgi:hypothetical protein
MSVMFLKPVVNQAIVISGFHGDARDATAAIVATDHHMSEP